MSDNDEDKKDDTFPEITDADKTVATNIDEEPTIVISPPQKNVEPDKNTKTITSTDSLVLDEDTRRIDDEPTVVEQAQKEEEDKTAVSIDLSENIFSAEAKERLDPRKIRSVTGTFKVYALRKGKHEGFVFEGLRKKDYTESEIQAGYEKYLEEKANYKPSLFEKLKIKITNLLNKKR